jgi:hypothetical protein
VATARVSLCCDVERSETSLAIVWLRRKENDPRFFASLRMTRIES